MQFYAVQTMANNEVRVAEAVEKMENPPVTSVLCPQSMSGYVIIGAESREKVEQLVQDVGAAKRVLPGETSWEEVEGFLSPASSISSLEKGSTVEILHGSFEGETARVKSLNKNEEKATVELVDAVVSIPVQLPGDQLRELKPEEKA